MNTIKDKYGKTIDVGSRVAFNWSGNVCIGFIQKIKTSKRYGKDKSFGGELFYNFHIKHQNSIMTSIVRNKESIAVL